MRTTASCLSPCPFLLASSSFLYDGEPASRRCAGPCLRAWLGSSSARPSSPPTAPLPAPPPSPPLGPEPAQPARPPLPAPRGCSGTVADLPVGRSVGHSAGHSVGRSVGLSAGLSAALVLSACAVADAPGAAPPRAEVLEQGDELEEPGLAPLRELDAELEAEIEGLGLRISPRVAVEERGGATVWRVEGRATVPLGSVASWVPDDAYGLAELTGPQSFTITFRDPSEQNTMASGLPLFVTVAPLAGARAEAAIWFRPRLQARAGSASLSPQLAIAPVWIADAARDHLEYRGQVTSSAGWRLLSVAGHPPPQLRDAGPRRTRLAWTFSALAATAEQPAPQLTLFAQRQGVPPPAALAIRAVSLELRAIRLGLTREDPRRVWPAICEPLVRACLLTLPSLDADTERCGNYRQVLACGGPAGARQPPSELL